MGRWAQKSRRGGGGQPPPPSLYTIVLTSAFAPFNGTFTYPWADTVNGYPFYLRDGDATKGQLAFISDDPDYSGWVVEIDNVGTGDFALFYGPRGTNLPPTNVGLYTTAPPPGFDPNTKVVTLVSITPTFP